MERKGLRILFLEDSEEDAVAVIRLLTKAGYTLQHQRVETEDAFQDALDRGIWDIILADYNLPAWTGVEALQAYKSRGLDIPFIIVSGVIEEEAAVAAMKSGAHDFITKGRLARLVPVVERELYETRIRAAQRRAERERSILSDAGSLAAMPLDHKAILAHLARTVVGRFADWCVIDVADSSGRLEPVELVHADAAKQPLLEQMRKYISRTAGSTVTEVFRTAEPVVMPVVSPEVLAQRTTDPEHRRLVEAIGCSSFISVPLIAAGHKLGVLTYVYSRTDSHYSNADLDLALELARRAAILIENARLYQQANEANRLKDQFLAMVSHELRTPLTPILGAVYMMRGNLHNREVLEKAIDVVERNAKIQAEIVDDLLDISRMVSGKLRLMSEVVDLPAIIEKAVNTAREAFRGSQIAFDRSNPVVNGRVVGDPSRLAQILMNLLSNATKFTPPGGTITVSLEQPGPETVQILVADTGKGIHPDFLPFVFDRFRQADASSTRATGGLGLGLAIARDLVELHGGDIRAYSDGPGKGATFVVSLPVQSAVDTAGLTSPHQNSASSG